MPCSDEPDKLLILLDEFNKLSICSFKEYEDLARCSKLETLKESDPEFEDYLKSILKN